MKPPADRKSRASGNRHAFAQVVLLVAGAIAAPYTKGQADEESDTVPGATYESLARLPDFSGWWYWDLDPSLPPIPFLTAPVKAEIAALLGELNERVAAGELPDLSRGTYCRPPLFHGFSGGFSSYVEFLFTPGRVTIAEEHGLVRRVYLGDLALPADLEESHAGTSVGRWEGSTLVIETAGIKSDAEIFTGFPIGKEVRIFERLSLKDPDTLEIALRVVAPAVFTAPFETTFVYRRDRAHVFHEDLTCVEDDRSVDHATGSQRFDLTPPADLPPPPP